MKTEKNDLDLQKKKVYEKIDPILQLYDKGEITKIELVEKLTEVFYYLEDEIIICKMRESNDVVRLHNTLENIFG